MVVVTATILLAVGGAFVGATRNLNQHAGTADQLEQAKEALAGAAEWARLEAPLVGDQARTATLQLSRATVVVKLARTSQGLSCDAVATVKPDVTLAATIGLGKRDDRWTVGSFAIAAPK